MRLQQQEEKEERRTHKDARREERSRKYGEVTRRKMRKMSTTIKPAYIKSLQ